MDFFSPTFEFKVVSKEAGDKAIPQRGTSQSAGYDVIACITETIVLKKGDPARLIPLGFACHIKNPNYAGLLLPRSGLGHKQGLVLGNGVGLIDADYQDEYKISLLNRGQQEDEIVIHPYDRVGQLIFIPVIHPTFVHVDKFTEETERGLGGFGSTGISL